MAKSLKQASAAIWTLTKLNPQQEKFVRLLAEGMPAATAYAGAGYAATGKNVPDANACRLLSISQQVVSAAEELRPIRPYRDLIRHETALAGRRAAPSPKRDGIVS